MSRPQASSPTALWPPIVRPGGHWVQTWSLRNSPLSQDRHPSLYVPSPSTSTNACGLSVLLMYIAIGPANVALEIVYCPMGQVRHPRDIRLILTSRESSFHLRFWVSVMPHEMVFGDLIIRWSSRQTKAVSSSMKISPAPWTWKSDTPWLEPFMMKVQFLESTVPPDCELKVLPHPVAWLPSNQESLQFNSLSPPPTQPRQTAPPDSSAELSKNSTFSSESLPFSMLIAPPT
mmetsp:Transcript_34267/g.72996  ORF Transcript_34267/g.72996 Transcript_34267/m.72996 type:complete len:232 (-) Transcript_34267:911-1606(-)